MKKENRGLFSKTKNKITSLLRAKSRENYDDYKGPSFLGSLLPPLIISILLSYMDTISLTKLEQCCHLLRNTVITTKEYKRRVKRMMNTNLKLLEVEEDKQIHEENSFYYKWKIVQHLKRDNDGPDFYITDHRAGINLFAF